MSRKALLPNAAYLNKRANRRFAALIQAKRKAMWDELLDRWFLLGGWPGSTDTYKRTMWAAVPEIATLPAAYHLTMRKGVPEPGGENGLVMAGHEFMLAQWFRRPLKRRDIELQAWFYSRDSKVKVFPFAVWQAILDSQPHKQNIYLPIDVWGFPGGQTFLPGVPCMSFEGMGGALSYLEPHMCRYFAPIIHATKARIMREATDRDAEFGMRAALSDASHIELLLARFIGAGNGLTSNDLAEFLAPHLFQSIGTIGHEMMCAAQSFDKTLTQAEYAMMDRAAKGIPGAKLLPDLVDAETIGLENAMWVMRNNPENETIGIRVDSGDIDGQCVRYFQRMKKLCLKPRMIVFEDEVEPQMVKRVYDNFRQETGEEPTLLFPGAGGYWWKLVLRDTVAAVFKRSWTNGNPNRKFSNSPGKGSLPGQVRVYGKDDTMIVADVSESIDGIALYTQLVKQGRIVYNETPEQQAARTPTTWGQYKQVVYSPLIQEWNARFEAMREEEIAAAKVRLGVE